MHHELRRYKCFYMHLNVISQCWEIIQSRYQLSHIKFKGRKTDVERFLICKVQLDRSYNLPTLLVRTNAFA